MSTNDNYPAGVTNAHRHFNPEVCGSCGEELDEDRVCTDPDCGLDHEAAEDAAMDLAIDVYRDQERGIA